LATTNAEDNVSAPTCGYCKKNIIDKESIVVCKGPNKETFHQNCVLKREGFSLTRGSHKGTFNKKEYTCKACKAAEKKSMSLLKRQGSTNSEPNILALYQEGGLAAVAKF
jgi:hypothetical protein